jgi:hypothetical protein
MGMPCQGNRAATSVLVRAGRFVDDIFWQPAVSDHPRLIFIRPAKSRRIIGAPIFKQDRNGPLATSGDDTRLAAASRAEIRRMLCRKESGR